MECLWHKMQKRESGSPDWDAKAFMDSVFCRGLVVVRISKSEIFKITPIQKDHPLLAGRLRLRDVCLLFLDCRFDLAAGLL
jgi:hypothetical protein